MNIAVTGATGFLGRYVVAELVASDHRVDAWFRGGKGPEFHEQSQFNDQVRWIRGQLGDQDSTHRLLAQADAVVHAGLFRQGPSFLEDPTDPVDYFQINVIGSLQLLQTAIDSGVKRFVYVSSGAVHQRVLGDRPLDETHPLWPESIYGASKAAVETLIHAYGFSGKLDCCSLRPTAIYGVADPVADSKWYDLITDVAAGKTVEATGGSKEVHVADVARAIRMLLETSESIAGETFNCSDRMISRHEVAETAKRLSGSFATINGQPKQAKHKIDTTKIERLGMQFGGTGLLEKTILDILSFQRSED